MTVNRRTFLLGAGSAGVLAAGLGGSAVYYAAGSTDSTTATDAGAQPAEEPPDDVAQLRPLAEAYLQELSQHAEELRVFINRDGEIAAEYVTTAESEEALSAEIHRYADLYAGVVDDGNHDPATLSLITGEVQAIAPEHTVEAYVADDIDQEAFHETIEVTTVGRPDDE